MIVITAHLVSAIDGKTTQLGQMIIANDGTGSDAVCHYDGAVMTKPNFKRKTRTGRVENHRRHALTIWHLIAKMLSNMGYVK